MLLGINRLRQQPWNPQREPHLSKDNGVICLVCRGAAILL
jgi:hypothetical protein